MARIPARISQPVYWTLSGALLGLGTISLFTVGWTLLFLGLGLAVYGIIQFGPRRAWPLMLGYGALPALVLAFDIAAAIASPTPQCPISGPVVIPFWVTCGDTARGYRAMDVTTLVFVAIAIGGLVLGLVIERWVRTRPMATAALAGTSARQERERSFPLSMHLIVLAATFFLLVMLPAYGQAILAVLGMIAPPLFLAFPLLIFVLSLLQGWRGWMGMLLGYIALQLLLRLFFAGIALLVPPPCSAPLLPCALSGVDPLVFAGYPGQVLFAGAIAGLLALVLHALLRGWPRRTRPASA